MSKCVRKIKMALRSQETSYFTMRLPILSKLIFHSLIIFLLAVPTMADDNKDKSGCASINQKEIQEILAAMNLENVSILYVKDSSVAGICEIAIDRGNQPAIFYIDGTKKHMLLGNIIDIKTMTDLTSQAAKVIQDKKKIDISIIPLNNALVLGDAKAAKKVIIFNDPDCPYCNNLHVVLKKIVSKRKDISFFIKLYPLEFHEDAYWKSKSIICTKSLSSLEDCFDKKQIAKTDCNTDEIDNNLKLAKYLGISGTPAIILPDGRLRIGTLPENELINLIDGKL